MPPPRFEAGINNPNLGGIKTAPVEPTVFEQAGALQSTAATGGAEAEIAGLEQAIQQLMQMQGQGFTPEGPSAFTTAGLGALEGVQHGSTIGGFGDRLNQIIGGDQFQGLVGERQRGVQGQLAAGGLTRSGTAIDAASAIPTDLAFQLENQLFGRESGLANLGFQSQFGEAGRNFAGGQADIGREFGLNAQIAALLGGQGQVRGEGIRGAAEAEAGGILGEEGFKLQQQMIRNQGSSSTDNLLDTGVKAAAIYSAFSDPRLKTNVMKSGKVGPLDLITWDWIEEAKATIVGNYRTIGFMSTQVKEFFPEFVGEYGGYDVVDYSGLMERLDG